MSDDNSCDTPQAKRRKTRKGTRSCWECKRRKIRCIFLSPTDAICVSCSRRCTECVSQEFPDQTTPERSSRLVGDRFVRMEAMIAKLATQPGVDSAHSRPRSRGDSSSANDGADFPTPAASNAESAAPSSTHATQRERSAGPVDGLAIPGFFVYEDKFGTPAAMPHAPHPQVVITATPSTISAKLRDFSRTLLAAYPNEAYVNVLIDASSVFLNTYQAMFHPYHELEEWFAMPWHQRPDHHLLHNRHTAETHPVVIAEQMLILANVLQQATSNTIARLKSLSDQPPRAVMSRLATTATSMVTANDMMLGTCEGMTCLILDSIYQANEGNLRHAWLAHRRIVGVAQAIGIHRRPYRALSLRSVQSNCILDPRFLWYRILYIDRFLSLMLGLPLVSLDSSMVSEPALSQDTPMGQLERRHAVAAGQILERNDREPGAEDFALTQSIDSDLQKAASSMPSKWWLEPTPKPSLTSQQRFWESRRLINQTYHFYLLHQLHLPYMIIGSTSAADQSKYDYSRNTCISASRDILTRCLNNLAEDSLLFHCRLLNFLALMASLTLLLMHLHIRRHETGACFLAHQRLADRAMIEQVLEALEEDDAPVDDGESQNPGARMIRQLLAIDTSLDTGSADSSKSGATKPSGPIRFFVPCFGVISISRGGKITTEGIIPGDIPTNLPQLQGRTSHTGLAGSGTAQQEVSPVAGAFSMIPVDDNYSSAAVNPLPIEDANHWALQGVDFAFFDSLMRESSGQMGDISDL